MSSSNIILAGDAYSNFADTIKSEATLFQYRYGIMQFMKYLQITDIDNLMVLAQDAKGLQQKIVDYIKHMKDNKRLGAVSIESYLASVMHFYAMNDITLNRKRISRYIPQRLRRQQDRAYTVQEIARLLEFCDLRNRAIVLLFASTGMRIGAIPDLRLQHLTKIEKYALYQITVYEGYQEEYICFCTPEAANAIDVYLQHRERCGERITPKSPLFRQQFDVSDLGEIRAVEPIGKSGIIKALTRASHLSAVAPVDPLKAGEIPAKDKRKAVMKSHGFRKFVNTVMVNARLNDTIRNKLLGHSVDLDKNYYRPKTDDLLQEYLKVVDMLTINEEHRLRRKVQELTIKTDKLDLLHDEIQELKDKMGLK